MEIVVKRMVAFVLSLSVLLLAGCQGRQETVEAKIEGVVKTVFTVQEGEQMELLQALYSPEALTSSEPEEAYFDYFRKQLPQEDMTADCYEDLPLYTLQSLVFPAFCVSSGATVKPQEVSVSLTAEKSRVYAYTAQLEITKAGTDSSAEVEGTVQLDEEGKITFFEATELEELLSAVTS